MVLLVGLGAREARAEDFVGEFQEDDEADASEEDLATPAPDIDSSDPDQWIDSPDIGIAGGLGVGASSFSAELSLLLDFNAYVGMEISGRYRTSSSEGMSRTTFGPDTILVLRFANPTRVTPFVGAGLGYRFWDYQGVQQDHRDERSSPVALALGGATLDLTRSFAVKVAYRLLRYLDSPPRQLVPWGGEEPASSGQIEAGFLFRAFL